MLRRRARSFRSCGFLSVRRLRLYHPARRPSSIRRQDCNKAAVCGATMEETVLDDRSPSENVGNVRDSCPNRNNLMQQLSKTRLQIRCEQELPRVRDARPLPKEALT